MTPQVENFLDILNAPLSEPIPLEETPSTTPTDLPSLKLFPKMEQRIMDLYMEDPSLHAIALKCALPVVVVMAVVKRRDVREHLEALIEIRDTARIEKLKLILEGAIEARVDEVDSLADVSKKDTLEILKVYSDILATEKKSRKPDAEQNVYVNILNQVMGD